MTLAQQRRADWNATHDIYGQTLDQQIEHWELIDEWTERRRQSVQARIDAFKAGHHSWLTPMLIDEARKPSTGYLYDYGRDVHDESEYAIEQNYSHD